MNFDPDSRHFDEKNLRMLCIGRVIIAIKLDPGFRSAISWHEIHTLCYKMYLQFSRPETPTQKHSMCNTYVYQDKTPS